MSNKDSGTLHRIRTTIIGKPRSLEEGDIFHKVSLIAILAWVGLGADGLSSSCYGPEETFRALGQHTALAPFIALACMLTIGIICASYSQIIELFPGGGGGYLVASKLLSPALGVVSGCALLVDYVLTISISIASGADQLFSVIPAEWHDWKLAFAAAGVLFMTTLNLRGVKESVLFCAPIFFIFIVTHAFAILYGVITHFGSLSEIVVSTGQDVKASHAELGTAGLLLLLLRAYSVGAGTYTGIEAVSNGLPLLREPRVANGKRTMIYMGLSLGLTVGGLLFAYLLYNVAPHEGLTLNAVLFHSMTQNWPRSLATIFMSIAMLSAAALLFIAAQAGFLDGPRVLANLALDRWMPARFATLSDRLVAQNGVLIMGGAALIVLIATRGSVGLLVVLYSINVFITFTLSQLGMVRHWWSSREGNWKKKLAINGIGFCLTFFILISLSIVKFSEGGWVTLVVTGALVGAAFFIKSHYRQIALELAELDKHLPLPSISNAHDTHPPCNPLEKTAVVLVNGFNGLGMHTLSAILKMFPGVYRNFVFVQIGVVDVGNFKGADEIDNLRHHIGRDAERYADYVRQNGLHGEVLTEIGYDVVETATRLGGEIVKRFPSAVFFGGQLVFAKDSLLNRLLHNFAVFSLQREFFREGLPFLIVPILR